VKRYPMDRYLAYNILTGFAPHPTDEVLAVSTNMSGQVNIWIYKENSNPRRITTFVDERAVPISWSPDGERLLFNVDDKGNEIWQFYLYSSREGWFRELILEDDIVHYTSRYCWGWDNKSLIYFANRDDPTRFDLYLHDITSGEGKLIWNGFGGYQVAYWYFPDKIVIQDIRSHEDTNLYLLDLSKEEVSDLTPHEGEAVFQPLAPYRNGFFLASDLNREYRYLAYYDLERRVMKALWAGDYDVEFAAIGKETFLFSVNVESYSRLYIMDLHTKATQRIYVPEGVVEDIQSAGAQDKYYIQMSTPYRPSEIYLCNYNTDEFKRVVDVFYGDIPKSDMARPRIEYYKSFDGRSIHTIIYKPRGQGPFPVVIYLHGGPQSQSRPRYSPLTQYLVSRGVAVAMPNFRGSTGFGKTFRNLINRDWGGGELKDVEYLIKYLSRKKWVDKDRIGVVGGSFGGFLTLSCVTRLPDLWRVAVEWFGPSNLVTFTRSVPPYWKRYMKKWVGDPDDPEDLKMLEERSPITYVDNIRVPMMIVQGARDIRVVKEESEQIVDKLREKGIEVEYILYEDEGHGFTKEKNNKDAVKKTVDFLLRHLLQ